MTESIDDAVMFLRGDADCYVNVGADDTAAKYRAAADAVEALPAQLQQVQAERDEARQRVSELEARAEWLQAALAESNLRQLPSWQTRAEQAEAARDALTAHVLTIVEEIRQRTQVESYPEMDELERWANRLDAATRGDRQP